MVNKCITKYCKKARKKGQYCYSCIQKRYKENNPMYYSFYVLKNNAKRRGVVFGLTFDDFKKFAIKTNYLAKKGIEKESFHIDRINEAKGYFKGNIQTLTNSENVKKYLKYSFDQKGVPFDFKMKKKLTLNPADYPF